jgi:hypothetical protein
MPWPVHPNGLLGAQGDNDSYQISRSLRFNSADSAYLTRTPASASNRKTWTWSGWVKRTALSPGTVGVFEAASNASNRSVLFFTSTDTLSFYENSSGSVVTNLATNQVFRDFSSWSHIIISVDTTQSVSSERVKLYHNGTQITSFSSSTYPSQNFDTQVNSTVASVIGAGQAYTPTAFINGYITEINFIDGQALTPSSFGETDAITGRWKAKAYSGTYGTNGFYLKFADNSSTAALGTDSSGNGNTWTPNNFSVTAGAGNDSLVDSPTNYGSDTGIGGEVRGNYCTLNPLNKNTSGVLSNGNLEWQASTTALQLVTGTSEIIPSGKTYFELNVVTTAGSGTYFQVGIVPSGKSLTSDIGNASGNGYSIEQNQAIDMQLRLNGSSVTISTVVQTGDVLQVAVDYATGKLWFGRNNTWYNSSGGTTGNPSAGTNETATISTVIDWFPAVAKYSTGGSYAINFGQRPFAYTAPTGFKALCTTNLTTPTIKKPSSYFDTVTYTGTGATQTISVPGFTPDLVWIKSRGAATNHRVYDTTRGTNYLVTNSTAAEVGSGTFAFSGNGFIVSTDSDINSNGTQYVSWAWDEAPIAGMDVVSFASPSGTTQSTVGHNLGVAPKMIIAKNRDTGANNWAVFHSSVCDTTSKFLQLNTTAALQTFATVWGASLPTSSVFGVTGGGVAASGVNCIAYLFAEVEGFSKFGSYTGNGLADGPFVWCGFRPRWVLYKRTDAIATWNLLDTSRDFFNASNNYLTPNSNAAEASGGATDLLDIVSNGFKARGSGGSTNASGGTYIFAAFAEAPFKYARAR